MGLNLLAVLYGRSVSVQAFESVIQFESGQVLGLKDSSSPAQVILPQAHSVANSSLRC